MGAFPTFDKLERRWLFTRQTGSIRILAIGGFRRPVLIVTLGKFWKSTPEIGKFSIALMYQTLA